MDLGLYEREVQVEAEAGFQTKMRKNKIIFFFSIEQKKVRSSDLNEKLVRSASPKMISEAFQKKDFVSLSLRLCRNDEV